MTVSINASQAIEALRAITAPDPEFVYRRPAPENKCLYTHNGAGSCGVGVALLHLGVPFNVVAGLDYANLGGSMGAASMAPWLHDNGVTITQKACDLFAEFQNSQDRQATWGHALERAERFFSWIGEQS